MTELEIIVDELSEQHRNTYTVEEIQAQANTLQMKNKNHMISHHKSHSSNQQNVCHQRQAILCH